jgi:hypothetical protein
VSDALQIISYGVNTGTTTKLFDWMKKPELFKELSEDLVAKMKEFITKEEDEIRLSRRRINECR